MRPTKPAPMRPEVTTVGVRLKTRERLRHYIEEQRPRLVMTDVVSIAVERYLDQQDEERERRNSAEFEALRERVKSRAESRHVSKTT